MKELCYTLMTETHNKVKILYNKLYMTITTHLTANQYWTEAMMTTSKNYKQYLNTSSVLIPQTRKPISSKKLNRILTSINLVEFIGASERMAQM